MIEAPAKLFARAREFFRPAAKVVDTPKITASVRSGPRPQGVPLDSPAILARYEAGYIGSNDRSWLHGYVQDARQDITPGDRIEMVRKARYFERNNATMQKSLDLIEVNVVGTGIHVTPAATGLGDAEWTPERLEAWRSKALARWQTWSKYADLTSRQSFETLQALMARAQAVDGEIFVWLTWGDPDSRGIRFPRIQLIETHRVCNAKLPSNYAKEGYTLFDGILSDQRGRPVFYIVTNDNDAFSKSSPSSVALIPADQMVHIFEPSRASQPRGLTLYHAVLHDIHDLDDLQRYEMLASKDAAERANVVYTESGELPDDGTIISREEQVPGDDGSMAEKITYYRTAFGAKTQVMKTGDKWTQGEALRPTAAQQEFWKILERKFCRGIGISYAAICDYEGGWSGPALRGAIAADNRFFDVRTQTLAVGFGRIWEHVIGADVRPGGELWPAPADWREITCQSPRRATVDIGRESKAIIEELRSGIRTYRDVLGEIGLDWRATLTQRATEEKFIDDLAKRLGVDRVRIASLILNERAMINEADPEPTPAPSEPPAK